MTQGDGPRLLGRDVPCPGEAKTPKAAVAEVNVHDESESANMLGSGRVLDTLKIPESDEVVAAAPFRTRWLFFTLFIFNASTGRFMSLYYRDSGLDEYEIGIVFAISSFTGPVISTLTGILADRITVTNPAGRHWCMGVSIIAGTIAFTLQAISIPGVSRFTIMAACRVITSGGINTAHVMADAITVQGIADKKMYGQERLYGAVSWAVVHIMLGIFIGWYGPMVQHVLIFFAAASVIASLVMIGVPPPREVEKKAQGLEALADKQALCNLLRTYCTSRRALVFFVYCITLGYGMTIVENMIFLLFEDLGASYFLMGLSVVVTVVFEIPLFRRSGEFLDRFGAAGLLSIAGLCYSGRVIGYTLVPGGWWVLLFEPMHGVTIACFSTASVDFVSSITPDEFAATGQAFLNLIRSGVGATLGTGVGGAIISRFGESACYRTSAAIVTCGLLLYQAGDGFACLFNKDAPHKPVGSGSGDGSTALDDDAFASVLDEKAVDETVPDDAFVRDEDNSNKDDVELAYVRDEANGAMHCGTRDHDHHLDEVDGGNVPVRLGKGAVADEV